MSAGIGSCKPQLAAPQNMWPPVHLQSFDSFVLELCAAGAGLWWYCRSSSYQVLNQVVDCNSFDFADCSQIVEKLDSGCNILWSKNNHKTRSWEHLHTDWPDQVRCIEPKSHRWAEIASKRPCQSLGLIAHTLSVQWCIGNLSMT